MTASNRDAKNCHAWWHQCSPAEKAYWCRQAATESPLVAWRTYKQALKAPSPPTHRTGRPCPACGHASTDALELPDGDAEFCGACGYRVPGPPGRDRGHAGSER